MKQLLLIFFSYCSYWSNSSVSENTEKSIFSQCIFRKFALQQKELFYLDRELQLVTKEKTVIKKLYLYKTGCINFSLWFRYQ